MAPGLFMAADWRKTRSAASGRVKAPGHRGSPGAEHSSTAEITAQKLLKIHAHSDYLLSGNQPTVSLGLSGL